MFAIVPKVFWHEKIPADTFNWIPISARCLLIIVENRIILVDTGMGNKMSSKEEKIYNLNKKDINFDSALSKYNISVNDITDIILTHLHFNHAGGTISFKEKEIGHTFPNDRILYSKKSAGRSKFPI